MLLPACDCHYYYVRATQIHVLNPIFPHSRLLWVAPPLPQHSRRGGHRKASSSLWRSLSSCPPPSSFGAGGAGEEEEREWNSFSPYICGTLVTRIMPLVGCCGAPTVLPPSAMRIVNMSAWLTNPPGLGLTAHWCSCSCSQSHQPPQRAIWRKEKGRRRQKTRKGTLPATLRSST